MIFQSSDPTKILIEKFDNPHSSERRFLQKEFMLIIVGESIDNV